jgi:hypothetical protein
MGEMPKSLEDCIFREENKSLCQKKPDEDSASSGDQNNQFEK